MAKRILLINDEQSIRKATQAYLETFGGWEVLTARSDQENIGSAQLEKFDAIVLDIRCMESDGVSLVQRIQSNPITQKVPVLLLTTAIHSQIRTQLARLGVRGFTYESQHPSMLAAEMAEALGW
jgi:response regulator RpfG family c-di-GMP phosphodiesterase